MTRHRVDGLRRRRHIRRVFRPVDARPRRDGCREATHRSSQSRPGLDPCLPQAAPSGSSSPPPSSTRRRRRISSSSAPPRASTPSPPPSPRRAVEAMSHRRASATSRPNLSPPHLSATSLGHISRPHLSASCLGPGSALSLGRRRTLAARRLRHSRARDGVGDGGVVLPTRCCRAAAEHGPTYQHVLKARHLAASQS